MIGALWHRWFDSREHRRAREVAEQNYSRTLVRVTKLSAENAELRRDLTAATARADAFEQTLGATDTALKDAKGRCKELERLLDERDEADRVRARIADGHAEVSRLPVPDSRDRKALTRLEDENAELRALREQCLKEHR